MEIITIREKLINNIRGNLEMVKNLHNIIDIIHLKDKKQFLVKCEKEITCFLIQNLMKPFIEIGFISKMNTNLNFKIYEIKIMYK